MSDALADGKLTGSPVRPDQRACHVVCRTCVWESLVLQHSELDPVEARAEALVADHEDRHADHHAVFEVVQ